MTTRRHSGKIVILNGAPRSGKTTIARAMQDNLDELWINIGVDACNAMLPKRYLPGIGLRPGGERPDLETLVAGLYEALFGSIAAHADLGFNVVADLGIHDSYSRPLGILLRLARRLHAYPVLLVGVHCPIEVIMQRREIEETGRRALYEKRASDGSIPAPVMRWQEAVHHPGIYDVEVDTSELTPGKCVEAIRNRLLSGIPAPSALQRVLALDEREDLGRLSPSPDR